MDARWKRKAVPFVIVALMGAVPVYLTYVALREHFRRESLIEQGERTYAIVTRSDTHTPKHLCIVRYAYEVRGTRYGDEVVSCPIMERQPVGSHLPIFLSASDSRSSLAVGLGTWPGDTAVAALTLPPWLAINCVLILDVARKAWKKRRRSRPKRL